MINQVDPQPSSNPPLPAIIDSQPKTDRITDIKTIYNVSFFEIIWRNLLAGMCRAMGAVLLYIFFLSLVSLVIARVIWPQFQPLFNQLQTSLQNLNQINNLHNQTPLNPQNIIQNPDAIKLFPQFQTSPTTK